MGLSPQRLGNYCTCLSAQTGIDDHLSYTRPSFDSRYGSRLFKQPNEECENTFSENEGVGKNNRDEASIISSDLFHGFLASGTLGSEPTTSEPATPAFPVSLENMTEEKMKMTENDLKLVNNELVKFLEAEEEETRFGAKKEKVSLEEIFRTTKVTDEIPSENEVKEEMQAKKTHKSAKYFIKKILTKFQSTSGNPTPSAGDEASNSVSTKKKLNKVLKMLHRKVHPENPLAEKEFMKSHIDKTMNTLNEGGYNADLMHQVKDKRKFLPGSKSIDGVQSHMNNLKVPYYGHSCSNSRANGEYWIKTDADCKY
ncbi:hypothetical protein H0E87_028348 [Populus deltoides]|uniref:LAZY1 n=1 Tax=Populus deltoides TaxID=3696 RepID=A0A8T2WRI3_POPDE|nr:hypothetical protein H0E87_028348 [Populus deltoides]